MVEVLAFVTGLVLAALMVTAVGSVWFFVDSALDDLWPWPGEESTDGR